MTRQPASGLIKVARDGRGFVDERGEPFVPWGVNYDRSFYQGADMLLEHLLQSSPEKVDDDFRQARKIGANVVRIFPQLSAYVPRLGEVDDAALSRLDHAIEAARRHDLRVDLTGLAMILESELPTWLADASDEEAIGAETLFWETVASRYQGDPALFCYNLQNEPYINWQDAGLETTGCLFTESGTRLCYAHCHLRDLSGRWATWVRGYYPDDAALTDAWADFPMPGETWERPAIPVTLDDRNNRRLRDFHRFREEVAAHWTKRMTEAIRRHDSDHLITLGLLPSTAATHERVPTWGSFVPDAVAPYLDFLSIHLYPHRTGTSDTPALEDNLLDHELILLACQTGKPLMVEEWFAYGEGVFEAGIGWGEWFDGFLELSRLYAAGWISFYHALIDDGRDGPLADGYAEWIDRFRVTAPLIASQRAPIAAADGEVVVLALDRLELVTSADARAEAHQAFRQLSRQGKQIRLHWT